MNDKGISVRLYKQILLHDDELSPTESNRVGIESGMASLLNSLKFKHPFALERFSTFISNAQRKNDFKSASTSAGSLENVQVNESTTKIDQID